MSSKCKALTTKGTPCTRDRMNDSIPYCWQHSRKLLEELMWGLDKMRDEEGELTPDDLTPEQVIEHFNNSTRRIEELEEELQQCNLDRLRRTDCDCEDLQATVEQLREESEDLQSDYDELRDALEECQSSLTRAQGNATIWGMGARQAREDLEECQRECEQLRSALDDCEEALDDCALVDEEMPEEGTEEVNPSDSGTFPDDDEDDTSGDSGVLGFNPSVTLQLQRCPDVISEEDLFDLQPQGSVGMFFCSEDEAEEFSGPYENNRKYLLGEAATISLRSGDKNHLKEYFDSYGSDDAWSDLALGSWVKPGDWFFFKNDADGDWYGAVIGETFYIKESSTYMGMGQTIHSPHKLRLEFEEEYEVLNLGTGVEFAIIIFDPSHNHN